MGVKNLWRLLLPIARRISLPSLSHQTLAIDASIWLTQISKACRDPETGRLLPNRPHVRIFLLRLMRLLFHEIKPVVVFDGVMPEVKRREIKRRRDRREKLWRDDEDDGDGMIAGGGAMKRTAKKILVQKLTEWRRKEASALRAKIGKMDDGGNGNNERREQCSGSNGEAFAAGFVPADMINSLTNSSPKSQSVDTEKIMTDMGNSDIYQDNNEVVSIPTNKEMHNNYDIDNNSDSENDWEISHAVQSSINDSIRRNKSTSSSSSNVHDHNPESPIDLPDATIASLSTIERTQWIDSQFRAQRIQSRQECIRVAADVKEYSSTQLRNFLKGSRLNKRMNAIGAMAGKNDTESEDENCEGRLSEGQLDHLDESVDDRFHSSDCNAVKPSMKVLFREDDSDAGSEDDEGGFMMPMSEKCPESTIPTDQEKQSNSPILLEDSEVECPSVIGASICSSSNDHVMTEPVHAERVMNISSIQSTNGTTETSKLREFATADQEWDDWGRSSDVDELELNIDMTTCGDTNALEHSNELLIEDSDTSSEDEHGASFLTLGVSNHDHFSVIDRSKSNPHTLRPNRTPPESLASVSRATIKNAACDENEDVDWEDGTSGNDSSNENILDFGIHTKERNDEAFVPDSRTHIVVAQHEIQESHPTWNNINMSHNESSIDARLQSGARRDVYNTEEKTIEIHSDDDSAFEETPSSMVDIGVHVASESSIVNATEITDEIPRHNTETVSNQLPIDDTSSVHSDGSDKDCNNDYFQTVHFEDPTTSALQHAQETASKLTSWAARAVQRAFAAHVEHHKGNSSTQEVSIPRNQETNPTRNNNGVTSADAPIVSQTNPASEKSHSRPPPELFDTSLEGLNAAHHAILEDEKNMERDMSTITDEMKEDILKLLQLCGIPWIESPSEAEAQCAALEELGLVDGIVTEDSDAFIFGGKKVYKNFFNEQQYVEAYYASDAQKDLGLGKNQLIALAMLLGSDYTDGVKGVGIVNGMEILEAFPVDDIKSGLQTFRNWLDGFGDPDGSNESAHASRQLIFHKKHKSARTRWIAPGDFPSQAVIHAYLKPAVDISAARFSWAPPDMPRLQHFCAETLGWDREETARVVLPVMKVLQSSSKQTRLESYFMKYDDGIKFAKVRSKRLKDVLGNINKKKTENGTKSSNDSDSRKESDESFDAVPAKRRRR